jgi:hypothetical protein
MPVSGVALCVSVRVLGAFTVPLRGLREDLRVLNIGS